MAVAVEVPNIHAHVAAICEQLGFVPGDVAKLEIQPKTLTATVYKKNDGGAKYIDAVTGEAATFTVTMTVQA